jgi:hypothetical protein
MYNVLLIIFMQIAIEACGSILLHNVYCVIFCLFCSIVYFIFKNRKNVMRTLLTFSLNLARQNRL